MTPDEVFVLFAVKDDEYEPNLIFKGTEQECKDKRGEILESNFKYSEELETTYQAIIAKRPKVEDYSNEPIEWVLALETHDTWKDSEYQKISEKTPEWYNHNFYII